ncbi:MAG: aryl-sulfate sulfotransferase [Bacilli bacterium]|nr:aryl-sulfate sulfotransferase [Bacilli bacterium]
MLKKAMYIFLSIIVIFVLVCIELNNFNNNSKSVERKISLVEKETELESDFCAVGYTVNNPTVILDPYDNSPLTALVMFETEEDVSVTITIVGKDELTTFTNTFESSNEHYIPIYGLYPDYNNEIIIEYGEVKTTIYIQTDPLPEDFILPEYVYADKEKLTNDLYFYTPSSRGYTCAYDVNGDVRWYLTNYALWDNTRLENGHLLVSTERLINEPYYMTGLYEIDLLGKIYTEFSLPGGYHHDYFEMPNGNLLVASNDFYNEDGTVEDYVVELDRNTGKTVKTFDLKDILNMTDGKSENWTVYDWFHNNSVWYDEKTSSITLSGRHVDAVINIDYDTGNLNWILGDPTNWSEEYQKYFFTPITDDFEWQWSQHAAMITPEGNVFLFDNGNNKSKNEEDYVSATDSYSRGVMYKIDTENMTIEQIWEYGKERGSTFYSPYISDVDYIDSNHYIIESGGIVFLNGKACNYPAGLTEYDELLSDTVELLNDEIIFELKLPTNTYRVEKMSLYTNSKELSITPAERLGSLGETEVTETKIDLVINSKDIEEEYLSHNISITKQIDRLVVSGEFTKENKVNIVLYQNFKAKYYNFVISSKPYTALCVNITTDSLSVTKYINSVNLKGKYSIYIEIDGILYNTKEYVEF